MNNPNDIIDNLIGRSAGQYNLVDPSDVLQQYRDYLGEMGWVPMAKIIAGLVSVLLFILIIILIVKANQLWKMKLITEGIGAVNFPKKFDKKWQSILSRMRKGDEANMKLAIIEADKLFDSLLRQMGHDGKDMGERLEKLTAIQFSNLENIWLAHKVRNRIVHEPDYHLTHPEAERAIAAFEKAFKELQVL